MNPVLLMAKPMVSKVVLAIAGMSIILNPSLIKEEIKVKEKPAIIQFKEVKAPEFNIGDTVEFNDNFGSGPKKEAKIIGKKPHKGRTAYDYFDKELDISRWFYEHQIIRKIN